MRLCLCCYWGRVSEWLPWASSRTRHRVSWNKQLWRDSSTLLFRPWPVLHNIVCTSAILPTPWAHINPPLLSCYLHLALCSLSQPSVSAQVLLTQSLPSSRHALFLSLNKDIVKKIRPRSFSQWHPYTNTATALKIHPCVKNHATLMCQSHYSLLSFTANEKEPVTYKDKSFHRVIRSVFSAWERSSI